MTDEKWRTDIYNPYVEAWKAIKILQEACKKPELFNEYMDKVDKFAKQYAGNDFAELLRSRLLLKADDVIAQMSEVD